jgi:hypothetical protein
MEITSEAWNEARPAISLPAIVRGFIYAIICTSVLLIVYSIPQSVTVIAVLLAGSFFFLQPASATKALEKLLTVFAYANGVRTAPADRAESIRTIKHTIADYAARAPDWDGMDGIAPRPDAVADALAFIDDLPDDISIPPKVYAPGDGEVMFQWLKPGTLIEVGFYGDDTISWYTRIPGRSDLYGDDEFVRRLGRRLPQPLVDALRAL